MQKSEPAHKKDEFHNRIRRQQLNNLFSQRRQAFTSGGQPVQNSQLQYPMKQIINNIITGLYFGNYNQTINALNLAIQLQKQKRNKMAYWLNYNNHDLTNKKIVFPQLLGKILERQGWSLGEEPINYPSPYSLTEQIYYEMTWSEIPAKVYQQISYMVLQYVKGISVELLANQTLDNIISNVWKIYGNSDIIELDDLNNSKYVINLIEFVNQTLQTTKTNVFKLYKQIGLSSRLCHWIKTCQASSLALKIILLKIVQDYCKLQSQNTQTEKQTLILGISAAENETFLLFGIWFIQNNIQNALTSALSALTSILQSHEYLVQSIPYQYYEKILNMITADNRLLSTSALILINDVVYYSNTLTENFVEAGNGKILDIIYQRCQIEQRTKDQYSKESINNIKTLLCNLLLIRNPKLKKLIKIHSIWELLYNSIIEDHPLFPLVQVYQYYFPFIGRKETLPIFQSYIYAISALNFNSPRQEITQIRKTIQNIYIYAQKYWDESDYEFIVMTLEKYKIGFIIENLDDNME